MALEDDGRTIEPMMSTHTTTDIGLEHQPILDLNTGQAVGSELYARIGKIQGEAWHHVDMQAAGEGLIRTLSLVPDALDVVKGSISVNLDPRLIGPAVDTVILTAVERCSAGGTHLQLELLEHRPLVGRWLQWVRRWRSEGALFVLDDVVPGDERLEYASDLDGVKISGSVIASASEGDDAARRFVRDCVAAHAYTVAEGIGNGATFSTAGILGVPLVQGFAVGGRCGIRLAHETDGCVTLS